MDFGVLVVPPPKKKINKKREHPKKKDPSSTHAGPSPSRPQEVGSSEALATGSLTPQTSLVLMAVAESDGERGGLGIGGMVQIQTSKPMAGTLILGQPLSSTWVILADLLGPFTGEMPNNLGGATTESHSHRLTRYHSARRILQNPLGPCTLHHSEGQS